MKNHQQELKTKPLCYMKAEQVCFYFIYRELDDEVGSYVQDDASNEPLGSSHSYTPSDVEMVYTEDNEQVGPFSLKNFNW